MDSRKIGYLVVLTLAGMVGFSLTTWQDIRGVLNQIVDDTFYYSVTAYNLSRGMGSTFDGIHLTNGYHPLWLLMQVPLFLIVPEMSETTFRIIVGLQVLLAMISTLLVYATIRNQLHNDVIAFSMAAAWIVLQRRDLITGLETPLYAVTLLYVISQLGFIHSQYSFRSWAILGFLVGIASMARLDGAFLGVAIGVPLFFKWWKERSRVTFLCLVGYGLPFAIIMLAYFIVNLRFFGLVMPISGQIKQWSRASAPGFTDPGLLDYLRLLFWPLGMPRVHILKVLGLYGYPLLFVAAWAWKHRKGSSSYYDQVKTWWPFGVFVWALLLYYVVIYYDPQGSTAYWYYAPARIMGILTAALIAEGAYRFWVRKALLLKQSVWTDLLVASIAMFLAWHLQLSTIRITGGAGAIGMFLIVTYFVGRRMESLLLAGLVTVVVVTIPLLTVMRTIVQYRPTNATAYYDAAMWIRSNTPEQSIVAAYNAGTIGFFSGRSVINLDGYINEKTFRTRIQQLGLLGYLVTNHVEYVIDCFPRDPQFEQLSSFEGHSLRLIWQAPTIYGSCELRAYYVQ